MQHQQRKQCTAKQDRESNASMRNKAKREQCTAKESASEIESMLQEKESKALHKRCCKAKAMMGMFLHGWSGHHHCSTSSNAHVAFNWTANVVVAVAVLSGSSA